MHANRRWHQTNDRYLAAQLAELREALERLAKMNDVPEQGEAPVAKPKRVRPSTAAPGAPSTIASSPPPALELLAERYGLTDFERRLLLLAAATELDFGVARACAAAHGSPERPYATFALAINALPGASWEALAPFGNLRRARLLEVEQRGAQPLMQSRLYVDHRIASFLKGVNYLDERWNLLIERIEPRCEVLPPSQQALVQRVVATMSAAEPATGSQTWTLLGHDTTTKRELAAHVAQRLGLQLCRVAATALPHDLVELDALGRLWQREATLLPLALYLDRFETEPATCEASAEWFVRRVGGLVFCDLPHEYSGTFETALPLDVSKPTAAEQAEAWRSALGEDHAETARVLAGHFNLSLPVLEGIAAAAPTEDETAAALWEACKCHTRPQLDSLAQRIEIKVTLDDLVLPEEQSALLRQIIDQVRHRGRVLDEWGFRAKLNRGFGVTALFAGDSGTGKTMAAEAIASALRLDLYRVDLSSVINKYIGETEKNLRRLFDAADDGGAVLLFDEADALFGKRTETKDAHDRYANLEVNYLLQRMESYRGLAVLATNSKGSLDHAFRRRLRFIVDFPFPEAAQRQRIWKHIFPVDAPLAAVDLSLLARVPVAGGSIQNIALNAAYASAMSGTVDWDRIVAATREELRKSNKPVTLADLPVERSWESAS
ncbi:MAG: ATP-binding protein [Pirellulales bacterium]|nr:ATP-binding protein [Pirellulales bacterium]